MQNKTQNTAEASSLPSNFIKTKIEEDIKSGKNDSKVITRFPPEPNGYLHIGHAKSICLNFGLANEYGGVCHLRFDDTNPVKEDVEYVDSIINDIKWLGFDWGDNLYYASDYFDKFYDCALELIKKGKAYVCDLSPDDIRKYAGTLTEPGKDSPCRNRSVDENLNLFEKMKRGEFNEGECVLRAKIDMASPNMNMRDPVIYRIKKANHHKTGDKWVIYPMYDFAHCLSDSIENITHSICTLEFEDHRPLYDWFLNELQTPSHPQQIEFARLNLTHTVMSKRKLLNLVEAKLVSGWDDPRMPTISGLRRRGYTPEAVRDFCSRIGVAKANSVVDIGLLEHCLREDLNKRAKRVMAVLNPLKVVITNYADGKTEMLLADNNPDDESAGTREIPFSKTIYIERDDFMEEPPKKFFRLAPGKEVRLKHAYYITCENVIKDENGEVKELHCVYDPATKGGWSEDERKVRGTLHWVDASSAISAEIRLYENLFSSPTPDEFENYTEALNNDSVKIIKNCFVEPSLKEAEKGEKFQFLRQGYFCADNGFTKENPVFNLTVPLKSTWNKIVKS